jgi:hypothetical protein
VEPTWEVVSKALNSLYEDELKPFGRILRKRIAERAAGKDRPDAGAVKIRVLPDVDMGALMRACEDFQRAGLLAMEVEGAGEWSVTLTDREDCFVDFYSSEDPYPKEMWDAAIQYFKSLDREEWSLPGGRYLCAQVLCARGLPFLEGQSLGRICHIVQLGINQKKLLGYKNGQVVPYIHSDTSVKDTFAIWETACPKKGPAAGGTSPGGPQGQKVQEEPQILEVATWNVMKDCMRKILQDHKEGSEPACVPMSNVKRLFRSTFSLELSETALGHSKLSELLKDPRLRGVCNVDLHGKGYIVTEVPETPSTAAGGMGMDEEPLSPASPSRDEAQTPGAEDDVRYVTVRTKRRPPTLMLAEDVDASESTAGGALTVSTPLSPEPGSTLAAEANWTAAASQSAMFDLQSPLQTPGVCGIYPATPTSLPSPTTQTWGKELSTPRKVLYHRHVYPPEWSVNSTPDVENVGSGEPNAQQQILSTAYCKTEPFVLPVAKRRGAPAPLQPTLLEARRERHLPEDNSVTARSVRNTFIDGGPPPMTPQAGSVRRRSQSLPKDVGSDFFPGIEAAGTSMANSCPVGGDRDQAAAGTPWLGLPDYVPTTPSVAGVLDYVPNTPSVPYTPSVAGILDYPYVPSTPAGLGIKTPTPMQSPAAGLAHAHHSSIIDQRAKLFFGLLQNQQQQSQDPGQPVLNLASLIPA